jgi:hypothetical protein
MYLQQKKKNMDDRLITDTMYPIKKTTLSNKLLILLGVATWTVLGGQCSMVPLQPGPCGAAP